jgi:hypothetical protein
MLRGVIHEFRREVRDHFLALGAREQCAQEPVWNDWENGRGQW